MKFWAKISFKEEKNAKYLIQAFFKEFNPESSIEIKGKDAKVEIFFENPPKEIIDAISHCEVMEFYCGNVLGEYEILKEDREVSICKEIENQIKQSNLEEENFEKFEDLNMQKVTDSTKELINPEISKPDEKEKKKKENVAKESISKNISIPELEEIVQKATCFDEFVKLTSEWLEMDYRQEDFINLVNASTEVEKVSWQNLKEKLECKEIVFTEWKKISLTKQVAKMLKKYSVTILSLLKLMRQYKEYSFQKEYTNKQPIKEKVVLEESISENRVKMECMPEIPCFEEVLGNIDKTQPIEDRVKCVLTAMGLNKNTLENQRKIFEITNTGVRLRNISYDDIFSKINIPMKDTMNAKMVFSTFINDFVRKYDSERKVKVLDFIKGLQEIIMLENEIDSFDDIIC